MTARYNFLGRDARGQGRGGDVTVEDLGAWVEKKYRAGWASLTVHHVPTRQTTDGRTIAASGVEWPIVARIEISVDGDRVWWAES